MTVAIASDYLKLLKRFPLRPIRNETEYDRAAAVIDTLVGRDDLTEGESDYLDALTTFIEVYDDAHHVIDTSSLSSLDVLKFFMEQHDMNATQLGDVLGSKGVASDVLNGKRSLSKGHMQKLAKRFNVSPGMFMRNR